MFLVVGFILMSLSHSTYAAQSDSPEARARKLVDQMTLEEKLLQLENDAPAIPRLNIRAYNYWSESLHGVLGPGTETVFPQAIGLAASWDSNLIYGVASAISDEARAKYNAAVENGEHALHQGLTLWAPNINIFRDPRWGRGQETYGEDPFLTAELATRYIWGIQGFDQSGNETSPYLKAIATPKHFALYSGPDKVRTEFNAKADAKDMAETFLPQFKAAIQIGHAGSIMCSYNSVNGVPACANSYLIEQTLRKSWDFKGFVVSDCGAIHDIFWGHHSVPSLAKAAALALNAGTDLSCGGDYMKLKRALRRHWIQASQIDEALIRLFSARIRLGMFEPPNSIPFNTITRTPESNRKHAELATKASEESLVLLKNKNQFLPLGTMIPNTPNTIAVIGPNANDTDAVLGDYHGTAEHVVTPLLGIQTEAPDVVKITYAQGSPRKNGFLPEIERAKAVSLAAQADLIVAVLGLSTDIETELHDRNAIELPKVQEKLLRALENTGKPIVVVLVNGGPVTLPPDLVDGANAILESWYGGQSAGTAIANALFGKYNPAGRLPVTVYRSTDDLPKFRNYSMQGRTYRYNANPIQFPFGFGLSYSSFSASNVRLCSSQIHPGEHLTGDVEIKNESAIPGDEVVEVYVRSLDLRDQPKLSLKGFSRTRIPGNGTQTIHFDIRPDDLKLVNQAGESIWAPGHYQLIVTDGSAMDSSGLTSTLKIPFEIEGH